MVEYKMKLTIWLTDEQLDYATRIIKPILADGEPAFIVEHNDPILGWQRVHFDAPTEIEDTKCQFRVKWRCHCKQNNIYHYVNTLEDAYMALTDLYQCSLHGIIQFNLPTLGWVDMRMEERHDG